MRRRSRTQPAPAAYALVLAVLAGLATLAGAIPASAASDPQAAAPPAQYAGNPSREAALVAEQQSWVQGLRTKASILRWSNRAAYSQPQLDSSTTVPTWLLPARRSPYTIADLLTLQALVEQRDGGLLLTTNLFVPYGARLDLSNAKGPLRLRSDAGGFSAVVVYGGRVDLTGTKDRPLQLSSWDRATQGADTVTSDGRAYLRVIGGQLHMAYAEVTDLGFWSGVTGGVSLTGTGRSSPLTVAPAPAKGNTARGRRKNDSNGSRASNSAANKLRLTPADALDHVPYAPGEELSASASIVNTTLRGNAYGLFVSGAEGLAISDSLVEDSLVDGVVLQRYVVSGSIGRTVSRDNAGDGFQLARGSQGVRLLQTTAEGNRRDGFLLDGSPLATGPSATGADVRSYGDNTVTASLARRNGRYGIEVVGGSGNTISGNVADGNPQGIVVRAGARDTTVSGNSVTGSGQRSVAVRDGASGVTVADNTLDGARTAIYIRDSSATVQGNAIRAGSEHGISLVGAVGGTTVTGNTFAGRGPSAIDTLRATGSFAVADNGLHGWADTSSTWSKVQKAYRLGRPLVTTFGSSLPVHPLTLMWLVLLGVLFLTSIATRRPTFPGFRHPYGQEPVPAPLPRQKAPSTVRPAAVDLREHGLHARDDAAVDVSRAVLARSAALAFEPLANGQAHAHPNGQSNGQANGYGRHAVNGSSGNGNGRARSAYPPVGYDDIPPTASPAEPSVRWLWPGGRDGVVER